VATTNGRIEISDSSIQNSIETSEGDIEINNTVVHGDVLIRKKGFWDFIGLDFFAPKVVIGPNSVVEGSLFIHRKAKLYVHETAQVTAIDGAQAEYYSTARP